MDWISLGANSVLMSGLGLLLFPASHLRSALGRWPFSPNIVRLALTLPDQLPNELSGTTGYRYYIHKFVPFRLWKPSWYKTNNICIMPYFQCVHSRAGYPILLIPTCEGIMHEMPHSGNKRNRVGNNTSCTDLKNTILGHNQCYSQI